MEEVRNVHDVQANVTDGSIVDSIESKIFNIRGRQVMLDRDLAVLYGVETKRLKEQVKRNASRFPDDIMFQLSQYEVDSLRSQFATSNRRGGNRYAITAFTETGIAMLSSVLTSERAIQINLHIMRAFVSMRHLLYENAGVFQRIESLEKHQIETDQKIDYVLL